MPNGAPDMSTDKFAAYACAMIIDALASGAVDSAEALEAIHYAAERDLIEAMRLFASLRPEDRAKTIELARALNAGEPPSKAAH